MKCWLVPFVFCPTLVFGQNLVPNGSFELFTESCEFGLNYTMLANWERVECAEKPDVGHECYGAIPNTGIGFQYAQNGSAMISSATARFHVTGTLPEGNPQTYATVDLVEPLVAGQHYCLRLWVNRADSSNYRTSVLHAFLWYGVPTVCNYNDTAWDTYAAVTFDISEVDTVDWTMLEGGFTATGSESNLTIGAFQTPEEMDTVFVQNDYDEQGMFAIYFIDNIELWSCEVGVHEFSDGIPMRIHPNPASDNLWVELEGSSRYALEAQDATGRKVLADQLSAGSFAAGKHRLDVSRLSPGRYVLRAIGDDGKQSVTVVMVAE